jgi:FkbM family methyltransferase
MISNLKKVALDYTPNIIYPVVSSTYWLLHPNKPTKIIIPEKNCWRIWTPNETYYTSKNRHLIDRGSKFRQQSKFSRYTLEGFVEVEEGDTVLDVGAFLGEFSLPAAEKADYVIAIEPDVRTYMCLIKQIDSTENIAAKNILFGEDSGKAVFKMADDPTESSLLNVDRTSYIEREVPMTRIDSFLDSNAHNHVDFLKMDAEGAEPEVIRGMVDADIRKVSIDAGDERNGKDTVTEVKNTLEEQGFEIIVDDKIVFGRQQSETVTTS